MHPDIPTGIAQIPIKRIRTFCIYDCTDIFIDLNGNLQSAQNMVDGLLDYCIEITDYNNRVEFISSISQLSAYFALQPLFDFAQVDWKTASLLNREYVVDNEYIKINKEKRKHLFEIMDIAEREQYARDMLDPRIKWL